MSRYLTFAAAMVGLLVASTGCVPDRAALDRNRSLETKLVRVEQDLSVAMAARDQYRQQLSKSQVELDSLKSELSGLRDQVAEVERLRIQLGELTVERDQLAEQFRGFRKGVRELLSRTEAALQDQSQPKLPVANTASRTSAE